MGTSSGDGTGPPHSQHCCPVWGILSSVSPECVRVWAEEQPTPSRSQEQLTPFRSNSFPYSCGYHSNLLHVPAMFLNVLI